MNKENNVFSWLPCSVVFVSTAHEDKRDIMTATAMFVSEKEPLLVISVAKDHLTEKLISQSGKFTLIIAGDGQKQLAMQVGSLKGEDTDKFGRFSIKTTSTDTSQALIPNGAGDKRQETSWTQNLQSQWLVPSTPKPKSIFFLGTVSNKGGLLP